MQVLLIIRVINIIRILYKPMSAKALAIFIIFVLQRNHRSAVGFKDDCFFILFIINHL